MRTSPVTKGQTGAAKLGEAAVQRIARAVGDPRRLDLLRRIAAHRRCVSCFDLRSGLEISPATLSHHVSELASAGLITTSRRGKFVDLGFRRDVWRAYLAALRKF